MTRLRPIGWLPPVCWQRAVPRVTLEIPKLVRGIVTQRAVPRVTLEIPMGEVLASFVHPVCQLIQHRLVRGQPAASTWWRPVWRRLERRVHYACAVARAWDDADGGGSQRWRLNCRRHSNSNRQRCRARRPDDTTGLDGCHPLSLAL